MKPLRKLFGIRLQQIRSEQECSQEKLAEAIHCTPQHLSEIERGISGTHFDRVDKIAEFLNVPVEDLFRFSELPKDLIENDQ